MENLELGNVGQGPLGIRAQAGVGMLLRGARPALAVLEHPEARLPGLGQGPPPWASPSSEEGQ